MSKPFVRLNKLRFRLVDGDVRLLNRLSKFGLWDIEVCENVMRFSTELKHKTEVIKLLGRRTYTCFPQNNVLSVLNFFYTRGVLAACLVLSLAAFFVFQQFAFRVSLDGLSGDEYAQVKTYLETRGVKPIMKKKIAKNTDLANDIVKEFPFAAAANVTISGSRVTVFVHRADNVIASIPCKDLLSTHDGVVGSIVVYSGVALVSVGKVVRKGDALVTGSRPTAKITIVNGDQVVCIIDNTVVN
jgi:similar to stage IV sporulation protein